MRAGSLRGAPLARLVSAYYAVHAGPCSVIRIASAWRKKLPTRKCGSAYPNCATCSPECCGAGGTALNTCCIGPSGEDDTNSGPCTATIESADRLCPHSIYNCTIIVSGAIPIISGDTSICVGKTALLDAGSFEQYNWNTGSSGQSISVD